MIMEEKKEIQDEKSLIEQAVKAAQELREANAERAKLLDREERLASMRMLGGRTEAGVPAPKALTKEEEIKQRVNEMLKPTGMKI